MRRRFLIPLWNVYTFFVQYANVSDGWTAPAFAAGDVATWMERADLPELDRWILLRLNELTASVTERLEDYDSERAAAIVEAFVEDLSNWYVRRSRRRFWAGEPAALGTLYRVLVSLVRLLAPFVPFTAEALYQNLVRAVDEAAPESVHRIDGCPAFRGSVAIRLAAGGARRFSYPIYS